MRTDHTHWKVALLAGSLFLTFAPIALRVWDAQAAPREASRQEQVQEQEQEQVRVLRARVEEFYGLLRLGLATRAAEYVIQDSRESFLNQRRNRFAGFEVKSLKLDSEGKTATVNVEVELFLQFSPTPIPKLQTTNWRLVDGAWYVTMPEPQPNMPRVPFPLPQKKGVSPPKPPPEELKFKGHGYGLGVMKPGESRTARFPFTNVTDHVVTLSAVHVDCECLSVKTEKKEYKPGESGELVIEFDSTDYENLYDQTIVVKTDPGDLTTFLRIQGYVMPRLREAPK